MSEAYILAAIRTPVGVGKPGGNLSSFSLIDLGAMVLAAVVERAGIKPEIIDDVVWVCVTQIGDQGENLARVSVLKLWLRIGCLREKRSMIMPIKVTGVR